MLRTTLTLLLAATATFAATEEFPTSAGVLKLTPIQHASLVIEAGGKILYVDPAQGEYAERPKADFILITDIHGDHMAPKIVDGLRKPGTVILAPKGVADQVTGSTVLANDESGILGPFKVEAIPMYNLKPGADGTYMHPKGRGNGYIVTYGGKRFYFSGDTEGIPEMRALRNIDVAFVCMNLPYTMSAADAAEAVRAFHPAIVYPYHYRGQDLNIFANALKGTGIDVRIRDWYAK